MTSSSTEDRSGNVKARLESTSPPVGVLSGAEFPTGSPVPLESGDLVLLFTDGVPESRSPEGEPFGVERMLRTVREHRDRTAYQLVERLHDAVRQFCRDRPLQDDVSALVIKVGSVWSECDPR